MDTLLIIFAAPFAIACVAAILGAACSGANIGRYALNLLIAFDQGINTLCGGSPDETISSACYRFGARLPPKSRLWRWAYRGVNMLFFWQSDHCRGAYNSERDRKHLPDALRKQEVSNASSNP